MYKIKILAVAVFALMAGSALAQDITDVNIGEGYALPSFREMYSTMIVMGGIDADEDKNVDEYSKLVYCDTYNKYFKNDFEWNDKRTVIRKRIKEKNEPYRVLYETVSPITLDRYDFGGGFFPVNENSRINNVNKMQLLDQTSFGRICNINSDFIRFPVSINAVLERPFAITKIKVSKDNLKAVSDIMDKQGTLKDRNIYVRIRFKVKDVLAVNYDERIGDLYAAITDVDFYYDDELTNKISVIEGYN